jgi:hypothetical protein
VKSKEFGADYRCNLDLEEKIGNEPKLVTLGAAIRKHRAIEAVSRLFDQV